MPASARTRNRAGSAPERAGVIDPPKSPASVVRVAVKKESLMCAAFALHVIFHARVMISTNTALIAKMCERGGGEKALSPRHPRPRNPRETPNTAANDTAVKTQRFHVMRVASTWVAGRSGGAPSLDHACESP